jgi:glycosyltransferase involved in cell wall biosynthesis
MGLVALAVSKILKLPLYSTYHSVFPRYTGQIMEDQLMGDLIWKYLTWYYSQADIVIVSSRAAKDELVKRGILKKKIRFHASGVDVNKIRGSRRNVFLRERVHVSTAHSNRDPDFPAAGHCDR